MSNTSSPSRCAGAATLSLLAVGLAGSLHAAQPPRITEWIITAPGGSPHEIVAGYDGRLWFTEYYQGRIGALNPATGVFQHYDLDPNSKPYGLARAGKLRSLVYTEEATGRIGFIALDGVIDPSPTGFTLPTSVVAGPDGRIWFTQANTGTMYAYHFLANSPASTSVPTPAPFSIGNLAGIALGPDGRIWYTDRFNNTVGACPPEGGDCVGFTVPTAASEPTRIAAGKDGALWFTERATNKIGRVTTAGVFTEYPVPTPGSQPFAIVAGNDGNIWFTEIEGSKIGRITPPRFDKDGGLIDAGGVITEFRTPTPNSGPQTITNGPDGNIWFGEFYVGQIGRLQVHIPGDVNESGASPVTIDDILYLINFLFAQGPAPKG